MLRQVRAGIALAALASATVLGCSAVEPVRLEAAAPVDPVDELDPDRLECRVVVGTVADGRIRPGPFGSIGTEWVEVEDVAAWLRAHLQTLRAQDIIVGTEAFSDRALPTLFVDAHLEKAYLGAIRANLKANVVVRMVVRSAADAAGAESEVVVRGRVVRTNWASGAGEARRAIDAAVDDLIDDARAELRWRCARLEPTVL